ncbi:hypothetical protein B0J11DRAFT_478718 [Dendryphion nanum]|uniref:Uncharacterized protein n=1 Tax=Dendryphion nanum TaxID=256645 RepID=A0A9P9ED07_9PLEO|nr:hypothetical protein B0J11DRAFT_478718 [Dendryphion nanum]
MPADDNLPWTTTRCNRLLRPISSRLTTLRKELEAQQRIAADARNYSNACAQKTSPRKATLIIPPNSRKPRGLDKAKDPDWVPGLKPVAGTKRTYGGRSKKTKTIEPMRSNVTRPGEITFTPFIARTGRWLESPQKHGSPARRKRRGPLIAKVEQIKNLKKQVTPSIGRLIEGLLDGYAKLLQATQVREEKRRRGARSLVEICLLKMPAYIELEEYFAELDREEAGEDVIRDISNEIYTHLEERFGTLEGQGWQNFRQVVRAHATSLLCDAFADEILGLEVLHAVVVVSMKAAAWDEAERFMWTFMPLLKPLPTPSDLLADLFHPDTSVYMHLARSLVEATGRHGLLYDLLEYMIFQELLPLEWLATECMRSFWGPLVRALSDGDHRTSGHALRLLETTLAVGMGLPDDSTQRQEDVDLVPKLSKPSTRKDLRDALDTTFSSLLTVLSSIALVSQNRDDDSSKDSVQWVVQVLDSIIIGLLKRKNIPTDLELSDTSEENIQTFAQRALWTVFASFLAHLGGCSLTPDLLSIDVSTLVRSMTWITRQYSPQNIDISTALATFPAFLSSTARCTGRAWHDDGFDQLQRLVEGLLTLRGPRLPHKLWNFRRLALESSMEFAQAPEHLAYTRRIENSMKMQGRVVLTSSPQKNDSPSATGGFRWEEGIGEWVACTPFIKTQAKRTPKNSIRVLDLLPTPAPSEASQDTAVEDSIDWDQDETLCSDTEPQSSPIKARKRRIMSPRVVIASKRFKLAEEEWTLYPDLGSAPAVKETHDGPRRSNRTKEKVRNERPKTRSSLDGSLRTIEPKTYYHVDPSSDTESIAVSDSEPEPEPEPESEPQLAEIQTYAHAPPKMESTVQTRKTREARKTCKTSSSTLSLRGTLPKSYHGLAASSETSSKSAVTNTSTNPSASLNVHPDDRDELGKTPAGMKFHHHFHALRVITAKAAPRSWLFSVDKDVDGDGSEDELSFA